MAPTMCHIRKISEDLNPVVKLLLDCPGFTLLIEGLLDVSDIDGVIQIGEPFCSVPGITFQEVWLQVLPPNLVWGSPDRVNTLAEYSQHFLPPRYCTPSQWKIWKTVCPDFFQLSSASDDAIQREELRKRYVYFASVQQHYYREPPIIERGYKQYLFDIYGRAYLDMVNNVAIIGHSHPAVTEAVAKQLSMLNTNSR